MADLVGSMESIAKLGLAIKEAADTARLNEEECREISRRVLRFNAILSQLQRAGMSSSDPATGGALQDLEESLGRALELVTACRKRGGVRRLVTAASMSRRLRRVKDDILNKDTGMVEIPQNDHSNHDARWKLNGMSNNILQASYEAFAPLIELRSLSELEAAMNGNDLIGEGGACMVYKGLINDGTVVAIKKFKFEAQAYPRPRTYDLLVISKLQHKNIVKILGYMDGVEPSMKQKTKYYLLHGMKYIWVEEYMTNGNLHQLIQGSELNWSSLFQIIQGIARGVHYLHEQRVVHMDVKPLNIILDSDMNPKITDF